MCIGGTNWPLTWAVPSPAPPASPPNHLVIGQPLEFPPLRAQLIGGDGVCMQIRLLPPPSLLPFLPQGHQHQGLTVLA